MRPGIELVLAVLRGGAALPAATNGEWAEAFQLAEEQQVLPSFAAALRRTRSVLPAETEALLDKVERQNAMEGFFWSQQLRGLLQAFAAAGVPVIPLKGPFLAERVYGDAALRPSRDLDLLVRPADLSQAEAVLHSLSFVGAPYPDDYHRSWQRETVTVELHFGVENPLAFDLHLPSAWERATRGSFRNEPAWVLHPQDEFLYLSLHGLRHGFQRLSYVLDLLRATQALDLATPFPPETRSLLRLLVLGMALVASLAPDVSLTSIASPAPMREKMHCLADKLWQDLMTQAPIPLDWTAQHRLYLATELGTGARLRRRLQYLRILATRTIAADYEFAARFGLHRQWQVYLLRQVRLVAKHVSISSVTGR